MSVNATEEKSAFDSIKWLIAIALLVGGVVGYNHFTEQAMYLRALMVIGGLVLAIAVVMTTAKGKALWLFIKESRTELRKVIWPSSNETVRTTIAVLVMIVILGLFLWGFDSLINHWVITPIIG